MIYRILFSLLFALPSTALFAQTVSGTDGDDLIVLNLSNSTGRVNGEAVDFVGVSPVVVAAGGGEDRIVVHGDNAASELVQLNGKSMTVSDGARVVRVSAGEQLEFYGDDDDRAVLLDSVGNDHIDISDFRTFLTNNGFRYFVRGVGSINITADRGGFDTVNVRAEEIGHLSTHENCVRLVPAAGSDYPTTHFLFGFERVNTAHVNSFVLEDTENDDVLFAFTRSIRWITDDYELIHQGDYERLSALSRPRTLSGNDRAVVKLPKLDETRFSFRTNPDKTNEDNAFFANESQRVLVRNFLSNEFEVLPGPSTQDARAVFYSTALLRGASGSLEERSFLDGFDLSLSSGSSSFPSFRILGCQATGFDTFSINSEFRGYSGVSIEDSAGDDEAFMSSDFTRFEGNDCVFNVNFRGFTTLESNVGGVDTALSAGQNVSTIGDVSEVRGGRFPQFGDRFTTTTLLGFEEETHISSPADCEARVHSTDDQLHQVFVTPGDLTYTPPSGKVKTFVGFSEYHVTAATRFLEVNSQYGPNHLDIVYDNENDAALTESLANRNYFDRDFRFRSITLAGRTFENSLSTLFVTIGIDVFVLPNGELDSVLGELIPGRENITVLNAPAP